MGTLTKYYQMNKRGQVVESIGVVILLVILSVSSISSYKILSEDRYIGDTETGEYYDLSRCIVDIDKGTIIKFKNKGEAINSGLSNAKCNN